MFDSQAAWKTSTLSSNGFVSEKPHNPIIVDQKHLRNIKSIQKHQTINDEGRNMFDSLKEISHNAYTT